MFLEQEQITMFHETGFLLLEDWFSQEEVEALRRRSSELLTERLRPSERVIYERSSGVVRSIYGLHQSDPQFSLVARHRRLVEPARRLLGGDVYVYQSKLNIKAPFLGDVWEWHQDYIFWRNEDGMPRPRVITAALFLDDIGEFNSPLVLIPGSQHDGVLPCERGEPAVAEDEQPWASHLSARLKYAIDRSVVTRLAGQHGLCAPKGRAGGVLLFDGNLAHASASNISPLPRALMLFTYNAVDNAPPAAGLTRPEFLVDRDSRPIDAIDGDVLPGLAAAHGSDTAGTTHGGAT